MFPNFELHVPDNDFYATLLQLGLEPVHALHKTTQTFVAKRDVATQTEMSKGILWGYF